MARFTRSRTAWPAALGAAAMMLLSAPGASADPTDPVPVPPGPPAPVAQAPVDPVPVTPVPDASTPIQAVATDQQPPPNQDVPHLSSPENLPPGTTEVPDQQGPRMSYLRELWHAYQTQEVSGGDALLLLTQRPMDAAATPPAGMPVGPQAPPESATEPTPASGPALGPAPELPTATPIPPPPS
jgi:resuscitation-promoting factor RpfA